MDEKLRFWFESLDDTKRPDEFETKHLLTLYSIKVPKGIKLGPKESNELENSLKNYHINPPYVLKVCSSNILHKTELQGVLLNNDKDSIKDNLQKMQSRFPNENILIENQASFNGPEFILGIIKDPALGHAVMVGAGGILTEIYKDTAFRLAPCSVNEAMDMLDELILSPVFENFRELKLDKKKLAETICQVSKLARDLGDQLSQLDINPIVFSDGEWVALDAKVIFEED
jgi:succinyl-CoA synthetase beta subunit